MTASNPVLDDLMRMKGLLIPRGAWTQYSSARKEKGLRRTSFRDPEAKCYCLGGALNLIATQSNCHGETVRRNDPRLLLLGFRSLGDLWNWNDSRSRRKAQILKRLDQAIDRATLLPIIDKPPPLRLNPKRRHWNDIHVFLEDRQNRRRTGQADIGEKDEVYMMWKPVDGSRGRGRHATIAQSREWVAAWVLQGIEPPVWELV